MLPAANHASWSSALRSAADSLSSPDLQIRRCPETEAEPEDAGLVAEPCPAGDPDAFPSKSRRRTGRPPPRRIPRASAARSTARRHRAAPIRHRRFALAPSRRRGQALRPDASVASPMIRSRRSSTRSASASSSGEQEITVLNLPSTSCSLSAGVAGDRPADAQARRAVAFGERRAGDDAAGRERSRSARSAHVAVDRLAIGLVDDQIGVGAEVRPSARRCRGWSGSA